MTSPWGTTLTTEVWSGTAWVDLSSRVRPEGTTSTQGRQSRLPGTEPGTLSVVLNDQDSALTVGNTSSAYYPWWGPGVRIRQYETLSDSTVFHLFDGYITVPVGITNDVALDVIEGTPTKTAVVRVVATDLLGRSRSGRTFVSTLGAHIMGARSAGDLAVYFPLHASAAPFASETSHGTPIAPTLSEVQTTPTGTSIGDMSFPADQTGPPGDDVSLLRLSYPWNSTSGLVRALDLLSTISVTVNSGDSVALAFWVRPTDSGAADMESLSATWIFGEPSAFLEVDNSEDSVNYSADGYFVYGNPQTFSSSASRVPPLPRDVWRLVTIRLTLPAGNVDFWVGAETPLTGTLSGSPPSSVTFTELGVGLALYGAIGHVQVYAGPGAFNRDDHLAQYAVGMNGLEGQSTGDRIAAIADYAGVPQTSRALDAGTVPMSRARLAGQRPFDAWETARATEQGRLFVDPQGQLTFHDRRTIYNV